MSSAFICILAIGTWVVGRSTSVNICSICVKKNYVNVLKLIVLLESLMSIGNMYMIKVNVIWLYDHLSVCVFGRERERQIRKVCNKCAWCYSSRTVIKL